MVDRHIELMYTQLAPILRYSMSDSWWCGEEGAGMSGRSWSNAFQTAGMCPATLLVAPMSCSPGEVELVARASADAGFPSLSLWASFATCAGVASTARMLREVGITARVIEAVSRWVDGPEAAVAHDEAQLDMAVALEADLVLAATIDPVIDAGRATEGLSAICELAAQRQVRVAVEFIPFTAIPDLATAWRLVEGSKAPNAGIVLDMLHWYHQPGGPNYDLLQRIPGERIHYVQVCDAAAVTPAGLEDYLAYALGGRRAPGTGVVDITRLLESLAGIDADPYLALEVFNTELARGGAETMAAELRAALTVFG
jgi:sugar phosphate isomerase/epimerase